MSDTVRQFSLVVVVFYAVIRSSFSGLLGAVCCTACRPHRFIFSLPTHHMSLSSCDRPRKSSLPSGGCTGSINKKGLPAWRLFHPGWICSTESALLRDCYCWKTFVFHTRSIAAAGQNRYSVLKVHFKLPWNVIFSVIVGFTCHGVSSELQQQAQGSCIAWTVVCSL